MFLAQTIDTLKGVGDRRGYRGARVLIFRVELNEVGRPVWKMHSEGVTYWDYSDKDAIKHARRYKWHNVPMIKAVAQNKLVSMTEAARLVDVQPPASLDRLTEIVGEGLNLIHIQNYVKPPKPKTEKPAPESAPVATPADIARGKLARARAKVAAWTLQLRHAEAKIKEWNKKARYHERRAAQLEAAESQC